jgi:Helicase conserved C-terminal domain
MKQIIITSLFLLSTWAHSGSAAQQVNAASVVGSEVRPTVSVLPLSSNTVTDLHLRPMFTTTIRLPEAVTSVAVGAPTLFEVEHSDQEPRLVFVNRSLMSLMMHRLLLYSDHPFDIGEIWGKRFNPQTKIYERFLVTAAPDLPKDVVYPKERRLIEDIRAELRHGRRCQLYATFTGEFDVAARLETVLRSAGFRVAVLRSSVPTLQREEWYERQFKQGVEVVICHPKLVETGLDLLAFPTLYFYETGYSLHTLRQASCRSWRIGQQHPVRVKFLVNKGTTQTTCLRLMGKKMLVALMMEGKFSGEGLHSVESDDDLMSAMARELVERGNVGESAAAVWADLKRERAQHMPSMPMVSQTAPGEDDDRSLPLLPPEPVTASSPALHLVEPDPKMQQKPSTLWPTGHTEGEQMLLFA